jgi:hypothetical protein
MRRSLPLTVVLLLVALGATAAVALAHSVPALVSTTVGPTAQDGGRVEVMVVANPVRTAARPIVGATYMTWVTVRFRCEEASEGDAPPKLYEAQGNADKRYNYGDSFSARLTDVEVFEPATGDKAPFKVTVTLKGKIAKTSKKAVEGRGTVVVGAPGCTTGTVKWNGKGRIKKLG